MRPVALPFLPLPLLWPLLWLWPLLATVGIGATALEPRSEEEVAVGAAVFVVKDGTARRAAARYGHLDGDGGGGAVAMEVGSVKEAPGIPPVKDAGWEGGGVGGVGDGGGAGRERNRRDKWWREG